MLSAEQALNKLAKWRLVFTGWQLGTRDKKDPEAQAVKDHREVTIIMRAELNAITKLLLDKGIFTAQEFTEQLRKEAIQLDQDYAKRFPGITTELDGLKLDFDKMREHGTMAGWKP